MNTMNRWKIYWEIKDWPWLERVLKAYRGYCEMERVKFKFTFAWSTKTINRINDSLKTGIVKRDLMTEVGMHYRIYTSVSDDCLGQFLTNKYARRWALAVERCDLEEADYNWHQLAEENEKVFGIY